jgi:hypothetical protein
MINSVKIELAKKASGRGSSGLYFIEDILRDKTGGTDIAFSRSWHLLMSFNFELILKAILILENEKSSKDQILKSIKKHDLDSLSKIIDTKVLKKYGIVSITKKVNNSFISYVVKMSKNRGNIIIEDLIDIRYDFQKDELRKIDSGEVLRLKKEIKFLESVVHEINNVLYHK